MCENEFRQVEFAKRLSVETQTCACFTRIIPGAGQGCNQTTRAVAWTASHGMQIFSGGRMLMFLAFGLKPPVSPSQNWDVLHLSQGEVRFITLSVRRSMMPTKPVVRLLCT